MNPIFQILESVYTSICISDKQSLNPFKLFTSLLETKDDKSIYDYLTDDRLTSLKLPELNELKTKLIKAVLLHDNMKLHLTVLDWMTKNNMYDDLKSVTSKYYSQYIEEFEKQNQLNIHKIELVWKYLQAQIKADASNSIETHNRFIKFIVPIIKCDTSKENAKVSGEFTINQRVHYTNLAILSIEEMESAFKNTKDLADIKKEMINTREWLILQSEVHNKLLQALKVTTNIEFKATIQSKLNDINMRIYEGEDLILNFTKPLNMHKYTIKTLQLIVSRDQSIYVSERIHHEVIDSYKEILTYNITKLKNTYPHE